MDEREHDAETIRQVIALAQTWRTNYGPEARCRGRLLILLADRGYLTVPEAMAPGPLSRSHGHRH